MPSYKWGPAALRSLPAQDGEQDILRPGPALYHLKETLIQGVAGEASSGVARPLGRFWGDVTSPKGGVKGCSVGT